MARIAGVDLPREKRVEIGLTYVFGIGRKTSNEILAKTGINPVSYTHLDVYKRQAQACCSRYRRYRRRRCSCSS